MLEISWNEALEFLEQYEIPTNSTRIFLLPSFYIETLKWKMKWKNLKGIFLPRFLRGYVFFSPDFSEIEEAYVHELSHGSFFENFPIGREIQRLDREVYELEKELFQEEVENIFVKVSSDVKGSRKVGTNIYEVNKEEFEKYIAVLKKLDSLHKRFLPLIESFAILLSEEFLKRKMEVPLPYLPVYEMLRRKGLKEIISYLYALAPDERIYI
jgi:hypothetical protein